MKKLLGILMLIAAFQVNAQTNTELLKHYQAYYKQMQKQGDMQGVINALTHLNVISPDKARKDTLAVLYMNGGKHVQALNTIGIDVNPNDSDMAVEVKAVCLQALNEPKRAIEQYEVLFKRSPNVLIAYEIADLKIQLNDMAGAKTSIEYGLANSKEGVKRTFYETQTPYQVSAKSAFLYLKALVSFREDQVANLDAAIALFDEAIKLDPNFNMAMIAKRALEAKKNPPKKEGDGN